MRTINASEGLGLSTHEPDLNKALNTAPLILIIDDDNAIRLMLRQALELEGYRVIDAGTGADGIEVYQRYKPHMVLLDAMMPRMDGFTCCQKLTALPESHFTPILMVTSLDDRESVDQAFAAGATDFVTKPIHWAVLRQRVQRLLQQVELQRQVQQFNAELETHVEECTLKMRQRTLQLHRALEFEATLKRITDKVRDSLDESQILQTAVQELAWALELGCCNAALYDCDRLTSSVFYEYTASIAGYYNQKINMDVYPELYGQLMQGNHFQFCSLEPNPARGQVAMFACPMMNSHGPIGDLWLINPKERMLSELEIRLVQQVANQCAIAIRQARLYQSSQAQVQELERLNHLKDDFLSTVSHELRTPLSNMRLAIQMLDHVLSCSQTIDNASKTSEIDNSKSIAYLKILHYECEREIGLINELLDLQRLDVGHTPLNLDQINVSHWLSGITALFEQRTQQRQQTLQVNVQSNLGTLVSDSVGLRRILAELLNNACKYTPPGETIAIAIDATSNAFRLSVTNTGVEIPEPELARIFEKFYRIPSGDPWKQGGTGLGLALVKRLVTHLKGAIQVESAAGQTNFTVTLPVAHLSRGLESTGS